MLLSGSCSVLTRFIRGRWGPQCTSASQSLADASVACVLLNVRKFVRSMRKVSAARGPDGDKWMIPQDNSPPINTQTRSQITPPLPPHTNTQIHIHTSFIPTLTDTDVNVKLRRVLFETALFSSSACGSLMFCHGHLQKHAEGWRGPPHQAELHKGIMLNVQARQVFLKHLLAASNRNRDIFRL